jgi:hypothetical protein
MLLLLLLKYSRGGPHYRDFIKRGKKLYKPVWQDAKQKELT